MAANHAPSPILLDGSLPCTVGFIGLGILGRSMATRLLNAGQTVVAFNRTRREEHRSLAEAGMRWADSPSAVAASCSVLFVCVTDSEAAQSVALGDGGYVSSLGSPPACAVVCEISTISPSMSASICARVAATGCTYLDTPFSGSHISVEQHKGAFMVGGDAHAFSLVKPLLMHIAPRATHVGCNGKALSMKIAVNLNLSAQMIAFNESVLLAERSGISKEAAIEVLCNCAISSPMIQVEELIVHTQKQCLLHVAFQA
jgi:3-hydroxyisobutyrate dehydrogenase-like beta-hydroxyacid dehydrogenase